jgi:hypothetical protein
VGVADPGTEEPVQDERQDRHADIPVVPRHGAGLDGPAQPIADDEIGAGLQASHEIRDLRKIVGVVGIGHHQVTSPGGGETGQEGRAVPFQLLVDHPCPFAGRDLD